MRSDPAVGVVAALLLTVGTVAQAAPGDGRAVSGAVTLIGQYGPDFLGASDSGASLRPGLYLRWGRVSVSSGAGWAARRQDTEIRGLGIDLAHSDAFDLSLGLRSDSGRSDDSSPALAGMGDVKRTIRARIGATWRFAPDWALSANWTVDAFNRGGGNLIDAKLQHERTLSPRLHLTSGMSLSAGGPRYMQTYHGVTAEQSAATGYPEYKPGTSLRDLQLFTSLRVDIGDDWVGVLGIGFTRTLGDVTDSPLTTRPNAFSLSTGIGWRF